MTHKTDPKTPAPDPSGTVPTLSFTFLRVFTVAATGSVGVAAAFVLSILSMAGVIALVIVGRYFGLSLSWLVKLVGPWLPLS